MKACYLNIIRSSTKLKCRLLLIALLALISYNANGQVSLSATSGFTGPITYSTLKMAFDSINIGKHNGAITINVIGNTTELVSATLFGSGTGNSSYSSILIKPTGGGLKTIGGSVAGPMIDLNGADNVTIDGLNPGNDSLLIVNQSTGTTASNSTIRLINGACNNKIQNCAVFGGSPSTTSGTIFISTDAVGNGNDSNLISRVWISSASSSATHRYGVYALGSSGKDNQHTIIRDCWIADYHGSTTSNRSGIYIGDNCNNFLIYANSFFQSTSRSVSSATYSAIYLNTGNNGNFLIRKNKIGGSLPDCLGTPTSLTTSPILQAIYINSSTSERVTIDSNEITNISMSTTNTSIAQSIIQLVNGKVDIRANAFGYSNSIGGLSVTSAPSSTTFSLVGMTGGTFDTIGIYNNSFGSTSIAGSGTSLRGIDATGAPTILVSNNIFGSTTLANAWYNTSSNSIIGFIMRATNSNVVHYVTGNTFANFNSTNGVVRAIMATGAGNAFMVANNNIYNLASSVSNTGTGLNAVVCGIVSGGAGTLTQTIENNIIHSIKATSASTCTISGITCNFGSVSNYISRNQIHSLSTTTSGSFINGIDMTSGNAIISNNMIRLGIDENGNSVTTSATIRGINDATIGNNILYNSIYIGGNNVNSGTSNTYCIFSVDSLSNREIKNNIFSNLRTNGSSTGKHYSARYASVYTQSINNNDYYNGSPFLAQVDGVDYSTFSSWRSATGKDSLSVNANPVFKDPTGNFNNVDLHIDTAGTAINYLESSGTIIASISTDIDGNSRPGPSGSTKGGASNPDIGADEFDGVPTPNCASVNAGTTLTTSDSLCKTGSVTLSLSGTTGVGLGFSYQWQNSVNGISFNNISSATAEQYTTGTLSSSTFFRCRVYCIHDSSLSFSTIKKITVLVPQVLSNSPGFSCGPGSVTLGATGNGTMRWYSTNIGGSPIDTGTTFLTPSISTNTIYYVEASYNGTCNSTNRTGVLASVRSIPTILTSTAATLCGGGFATLTATPSAGTINWYDSTVAGNLVGTTNAFITPTITSTKTYYAEAINLGCTSQTRTPVTVTVIQIPTVTSTTSNSRCGSGTVSLQASVSAGKAFWYSNSTGGTALDSNLIFVTPSLTTTTTYYVEAKNGSCISSSRTAVTATINTIPSITSSSGGNICGTGGVTLSAIASAGVVRWYDDSTNGNLLYTGSPFITPSISSTTTYYAEAFANGCSSSPRTAVTATINSIPSISSVNHKVNCGPGALVLSATGSSGSVLWYSDSIGGAVLASGNLFTTPNLTVTTRYWVVAVANGCTTSVRIPVIAEIKSIPTVVSNSPASACKPSVLTLSATANQGSVRWFDVATGGSALSTGSSFQTPLLTASKTYYAEAIDSPCVSSGRVAVNASIYPSIDTSITLNAATLSANAIGINYQWIDCNNNFAIINGAVNKSFSPSSNGSYAVVLSNSNCVDTSRCFNINSVGFVEGNFSPIQIFPNPASDLISIISTSGHLGSNFMITDAIGKVIFKGTLDKEEMQIELSDFAAGLYFLKVSNAKPIQIIKN